MALGRQRERQSDILVSWAELPRSPGHAFYDKLQTVLITSDFDRFVEMQCASEYAPRCGGPRRCRRAQKPVLVQHDLG